MHNLSCRSANSEYFSCTICLCGWMRVYRFPREEHLYKKTNFYKMSENNSGMVKGEAIFKVYKHN